METVDARTIRTDRLLLHPVVSSDLSDIYAGLSDPRVTRYYGVSFSSIEATREQMEWYNELERQGTGQWRAVRSPDGNTFYGAAGLKDITDGTAEIGCWLLPPYWRRGIMSEALPYVCKYGFGVFGLSTLEALVDPENMASKTMLGKLGFQYKGTREDVSPDGTLLLFDLFTIESTLTSRSQPQV